MTVYSVIGNVFAYVCVAVCAAAILYPVAERVMERADRKKKEALS